MATTVKQDRDFIADVIGDALLEKTIEWIAHNLAPEDVFTQDQLEDWAKRNGYVGE